MRNLFLVLFLISFNLTFAQLPLNEEGHVEYDDVITTKDSSISEVYTKAKNWVLKNLKSSDSNIEFDDESNSSIISTGNIKLDSHYPLGTSWTEGNLNFKISIYLKEGRCRVIIDNFTYSYKETNESSGSVYYREGNLDDFSVSMGKKRKEKIYNEINEKVSALLKEIEIALNSDSIMEEDW